MTVDLEHERHLIGEISVGAIDRNLAYLRSLIPEGCAIWPVVKANAYGLGLEQLWPHFESATDGLCVSNFREALELRAWGYGGSLLILFPVRAISPSDRPIEVLSRLIEERVELTVSSADEVALAERAAATVGVDGRLHLKIDTGMHRGGVPMSEADSVLERLQASHALRLAGVYTHFATAEEADRAFLRLQVDRFAAWRRRTGLHDGVVFHAANSAAALEYGASHFDLIRPGLAVYGCLPATFLGDRHRLSPALTLKSHLMQVKTVEEGEGCGYGMTYRFERAGRVGLVPIGYADGYLRALSNRATMRVRGREVPIRGTVAMDQTIVDLSEVEAAQVNDEVEIISAQPSAANSVESLARIAGTIPYEILTRLGSRIERRLVP